MEIGADAVLFADSDMVLQQPENIDVALKMLWDANVPIATGLYRSRYPGTPLTIVKFDHPQRDGSYFIDDIPTTNETVDACGLGFALIRREVFEALSYPWFVFNAPNEPGEDRRFCIMAGNRDFKIEAIQGVQLAHIGTIMILPNKMLSFTDHVRATWDSAATGIDRARLNGAINRVQEPGWTPRKERP
jgi:hypothetical protein